MPVDVQREDRVTKDSLAEMDLGGKSFREFQYALEDAILSANIFPGVWWVWIAEVWDDKCLVSPAGTSACYFVTYSGNADTGFTLGVPVLAEYEAQWVAKDSGEPEPIADVEPEVEIETTTTTLSAEERWSSVGKAEEINESVGSLTERHEIVESCMVVLESKGLQENGDLKIEGVCGRFDDDYVNANGRLYERKLADSNLPRVNERARRGELAGLSGHPMDGQGAPHEKAFKYCAIDESEDAVWLDGEGFMHFTGYIIPTTYGKDLIVQAERGMAIPFSWRGIGSEEIVERNGRKVKKVCEDYELITWDAVNDASCAGTGVTAIKEEVTMPGSGEGTNEGTPQTTVIQMTPAQFEESQNAAARRVLDERDLKEWSDHKDTIVESEVNLLIKATPKLEKFKSAVTTFLSKVEKREDLAERVKLAQETYGAMVSSESAEDFSSKGVSVIQDRQERDGSMMLIPEGVCTGKYREVERPRTAEKVIDLLAEGLSERPLSPAVVEMLHAGQQIPADMSRGLMDNKEFLFRVLCNNYKREHKPYLATMTEEGMAFRGKLTELTGTTDIAPGAPFVLPLVRDIFPRIVDTGLWGTQVMDRPTGKVFYLHFQTDPGAVQLNTAGSGLFETEESEQPPKIKAVVEAEDVEVGKIGVSYEWKIEAEQDIRAYHNLDLQGELLNVGRNQVGREWMWNMIAAIQAAATGGNTTFGTQVPAAGGFSQEEWDRQIFRHILRRAGIIGAEPDVQVVPNTCVVGALDTFRFSPAGPVPGWTATPGAGWNPEYGFGVRSLGQYNEQMRVFQVDQWSTYYNGQILLGYAGSTWMEQAAVFMVYIPLYVGPIIETLTGERGQAMFSRAVSKVVRPKNFGTVTIADEAGFALT